MAHNRKIVLGAASLTLARVNHVKDFEVAPEVMDEVEDLMVASGYLDNAPFKWVGLILRYGLKNEDQPHYQRIDPKDGELPIAIELDTHDLLSADRDTLKQIFMIATLKSLIHAGHKFKLPTESLERMLGELQTADLSNPRTTDDDI